MARRLAAAGSIVSRWWPRASNRYRASRVTASGPTLCPWNRVLRYRSMPACRYIGSSSSWYWMPPATSPPISMTSSPEVSPPASSPAMASTGSGSPHQAATAGSDMIWCSVTASARPPGRRVTRGPVSVGRVSAPGPVTSCSFFERAGVGGHVDGVLPQDLQRHDLQRPLVGGGQHHVRGGAVPVRPQPVRGGHAPPV